MKISDKLDLLNDCCGCGSCIDTCHRSAIVLEKSIYGYKIPKVDLSLCIDCGKCVSVCPVLNNKTSSYENRKVYSAHAKDEKQRNSGSSGSVFYSLGKEIIERGGVVYGAFFDEKLQLRHKGVADLSELVPLMKSKYIQSDTIGIFNEIKSYLNQNRPVLFVGTPCQCSALNNIVKDKTNLFVVDFICHGVPSQDFFDKSIRHFEKKENCIVKSFTFRYKQGKSSKNFRIVYEKDGREEVLVAPYWKFVFYDVFHLYASFRKSCYHCPFIGVNRVSDLTISDFWGLNFLDKSIKDMNKGYSMVITNSSKGEKLFASISDSLVCRSGFSVQNAIDYNSSYTKCAKDGLLSNLFRWMYCRLPVSLLEVVFPMFSYCNRVTQKVNNIKNRLFVKR